MASSASFVLSIGECLISNCISVAARIVQFAVLALCACHRQHTVDHVGLSNRMLCRCGRVARIVSIYQCSLSHSIIVSAEAGAIRQGNRSGEYTFHFHIIFISNCSFIRCTQSTQSNAGSISMSNRQFPIRAHEIYTKNRKRIYDDHCQWNQLTGHVWTIAFCVILSFVLAIYWHREPIFADKPCIESSNAVWRTSFV